jgi:hypothetical protein
MKVATKRAASDVLVQIFAAVAMLIIARFVIYVR